MYDLVKWFVLFLIVFNIYIHSASYLMTYYVKKLDIETKTIYERNEIITDEVIEGIKKKYNISMLISFTPILNTVLALELYVQRYRGIDNH